MAAIAALVFALAPQSGAFAQSTAAPVATPSPPASAPVMARMGFFEREIGRTGESFNGIAQVFSAYESRYALADAQPFERGINSIQLYNDGTRWYIVSVFWAGADAANPVPERYLGKHDTGS